VKIEKKGEEFGIGELWSNTDLAVQFNTPVLKDNVLYGYSNTGSLFCIDAATGKTAWTDAIKHDRSGFAAILDVGPVIMALPSSSELIVYKALKEEYSELAKIKIADLPTYATPVVAGNRIFIKDEKTITLWQIK
jgi:outer membrane protein assembly factor BamB